MTRALLLIFLAILAWRAAEGVRPEQLPLNRSFVCSEIGRALAVLQRSSAAQTPTPTPFTPSPTPVGPNSLQPSPEGLSANEKVVNQVASMYQSFGLFITIIVTLVGVFVGGIGYIAKKSVQEFIQDWTKKVESIEADMKTSLTKLHDAVAEAEASARSAQESAKSITESETVIGQALKDVGALRAAVESLREKVGLEETQAEGALPTVEALARPPESDALAAEEDAEVRSRLEGKIDTGVAEEGQDS